MASGIPSSIIFFVKLLVVVLLLGGAFFYISTNHKEELDKFYLKVDSWGFTSVGKAEIERKAAIDALADEGVLFPQREALVNKTVFLGATAKMVTLALGKPVAEPTTNASGQQIWVYYFNDYDRPTFLYFENRNNVWILSKAEKSSR